MTSVLWLRLNKEVVSMEIFHFENILNINIRTWKSCMVLHTDIFVLRREEKITWEDASSEYGGCGKIRFP